MERKSQTIEKPDLSEKGAVVNGQRQSLDRRLYVQFMAFGGCTDPTHIIQALEQSQIDSVIYSDVHDSAGIGLAVMHEDPDHFVTDLRTVLNTEPFACLTAKPNYTMLGRTYSIGYEANLEQWLLHQPRQTMLNPDWPWAIWYPLRRSGAFAALTPEQQRKILGEHGTIGRSFGQFDLAHDIRLACHGLDTNDNDFVIGLVGRDLYPLSALVQTMRKTTQTAQYLERLGPFFVGKTVWQCRQNP